MKANQEQMAMMSIIGKLNKIPKGYGYWLTYIAGGLFLLTAALYFQYVHDELPCTMCIHVRLWVALLVIVSLVGLFLRKNTVANIIAQLLTVLTGGALVERSYQLLGTERGFISGSCGFKTGLPDWFAINEWMPWLFGVETTCGYTPEIIFGITMAEILMVLSVVLLIVSFSVLLLCSISLLWPRDH